MKKQNYFTTYWKNNGTHQEKYSMLFDKLVPSRGNCSTEHGELLRAISKLHYDVFNNGLCNFDVLIEHRLLVTDTNTYENLKNYGLKENQWNWVYKEFSKENTQRAPYQVKNFVKALEAYVDAVILYCWEIEEQNKQDFLEECKTI